MPDIEFGTDGWRAIVADTYTFANVERVAEATLNWLQNDRSEEPTIVIGHDSRFMGRDFTERAARVFAKGGAKVIFGDTLSTTPAVSWATQEYGADAGIVITASHNPPEYNGYKIKAHFGGPASPDIIQKVENALPPKNDERAPLPHFSEFVDQGKVELHDLRTAYLDALRETIDVDLIANSGFRIAHDAMYGASMGMFSELLNEENIVEIRSEFNPSFGGVAPEPIPRNCGPLMEAVPRQRCDLGIANDGDGDRIGLFDEEGQFVSSHKVLALLVKYLHEERGLSGDVIKTFSTTHLLDRMCEKYGLELETTPIGFKYIAPKMVERDVLVGGEESGGIAAKGHIPERDGIYIGLLIIEMMVKRDKMLSELVEELEEEFGPHFNYRDDIHTSDNQKKAVLKQLDEEGGLDTLSGHPVQRVETLDGYKHITDAGWLLVRPSGTEPVLRVYSEAETADAAENLVKDAASQLGLNGSH